MTLSAFRFIVCLSLAGLLTMGTLAGCEQKTTQQGPGKVAIIDMARLAQASGFDQRIGQSLQQAQQQEQVRLMSLQKELGLDKQPAPTSNPQDMAKLAQAQQQMREAIEQAQRNIQAAQVNELERFRTMIRPIAERVAAAQGCSIVMEMSDGMLSIDPVSDITDQVVAEIPQNASQSPLPPNPNMPMGMGQGQGMGQGMGQGQGPLYPAPGSMPMPQGQAGQQPNNTPANPTDQNPSAPENNTP